ncbi:hypothetical protein [Antarctobacter jejuensis]|uniref:hypothetical protein n=1 Tax=Antarctobacter jejuensis TaxID=1439938 RepID=UPI003FCFB3E1
MRLDIGVDGNPFVEIKVVGGRTIGHVINGTAGGPNLLVAGTTRNARSVFQRVLHHSVASTLKGKLVLLFLDELDHTESHSALDGIAANLRPIAGTLFLEVPSADVLLHPRQVNVLVETVLNFCENHGAIDPRPCRSPAIPSRDS